MKYNRKISAQCKMAVCLYFDKWKYVDVWNSLGSQKHVLARVDLIALNVGSSQIFSHRLSGKLCLTNITKVSGQVYSLTCRH